MKTLFVAQPSKMSTGGAITDALALAPLTSLHGGRAQLDPRRRGGIVVVPTVATEVRSFALRRNLQNLGCSSVDELHVHLVSVELPAGA